MNHDDELRNALERMSATPPVPLDRVDSVHRRARRIRQRHAVLAGAMSVAVVAAAVGIAIPLLQTRHDSRLIQAAPTSTDSGLGLTEPPSATPTSQPTASAKPRATKGTPHRLNPSIAVPALQPSSEPGEHLTYEVSSTTDSDPDYPLTTITFHVSGVVSGSIHHIDFNYDNNMNRLDGDFHDYPCVHNLALHPVDETYTFHNYYRQAITYYPYAYVYTGQCGDNTGGQRWQGEINVTKGSPHSNGRALPTANISSQRVDGSHLSLTAGGFDFDGSVASISIDWGNGQQPVVSTFGCYDWHGDWWPYGTQSGNYTSPTLAPGTYQVTVMVTTAGCDGKDVQTASDTWTATVS